MVVKEQSREHMSQAEVDAQQEAAWEADLHEQIVVVVVVAAAAAVAVGSQAMEDPQPAVESLGVVVQAHLASDVGDLYELEGLFETSKFYDNQTHHALHHHMYTQTQSPELIVQFAVQDRHIWKKRQKYSSQQNKTGKKNDNSIQDVSKHLISF